jgi:hypothetical protein
MIRDGVPEIADRAFSLKHATVPNLDVVGAVPQSSPNYKLDTFRLATIQPLHSTALSLDAPVHPSTKLRTSQVVTQLGNRLMNLCCAWRRRESHRPTSADDDC